MAGCCVIDFTPRKTSVVIDQNVDPNDLTDLVNGLISDVSDQAALALLRANQAIQDYGVLAQTVSDNASAATAYVDQRFADAAEARTILGNQITSAYTTAVNNVQGQVTQLAETVANIDGGSATDILNLQTSYNDLSSTVTNFISSQTTNNNTQANQLTQLTTTVNGQASTISQFASIIDSATGTQLAYGFQLDSQGHVVGLAAVLDPGAAVPGQMIFQADLFQFHGDVIIDGTLSYASLAPNSVAVGDGAEIATALLTSATWQTIASYNLTGVPADAAMLKIDWQFYANALAFWTSQAGSDIELQILDNGVAIFGPQVVASCPGPVSVFQTGGSVASISAEELIIPQGFTGMINGFELVPNPAAGTHSIQVQARRLAVTGDPTRPNWSISDRKIAVTLLKR